MMTMKSSTNRQKSPKITMSNVKILNPWDSQGVQIADGTGIYPCVRGCGGGGYQQGYVLQHLDPVGIDCYNLCATGDIGRTLSTSSGGMNEHISVVMYEQQKPILAFKERAGCPGGGKGILIGENKSFTLSTLVDESICYERQNDESSVL